jgi:predicted membrane protein
MIDSPTTSEETMIARKYLFLGASLLIAGILVLFVDGSVTNPLMDFVPFTLIMLGLLVWVIPTLLPFNTDHAAQFIGEYRQNYFQEIIDKKIFMGLGDVDLDFSHIHLPPGETALKIVCFAADIKLKFSHDFAYRIYSHAFVGEVRENEQKQEFIIDAYEKNSSQYEHSNCRLNIEILSFVSDISIL